MPVKNFNQADKHEVYHSSEGTFREPGSYFLQKVHSICTDLDQQSLSLMSRRLTYQQIDSNFHLFHLITEAELKATILKSKFISCLGNYVPSLLLFEFLDDLLQTLWTSSVLFVCFLLTFTSAVVTPLMKKASLHPNNMRNLQPVSNLSYMSKITTMG